MAEAIPANPTVSQGSSHGVETETRNVLGGSGADLTVPVVNTYSSGPTATAAIAVIVPTYNRQAVVLRCLTALAQQSVAPGVMEVVVVDDGSTDGTFDALQAEVSRVPFVLQLARQSNAGANSARNRAIAMARAPLLLFLNDDSIAHPGLVAEHLHQHALHPGKADAILGALAPIANPPPSLFEELHHERRFDAVAEGTELGWTAFYTYNISMKMALMQGRASFVEGMRWHEDIELGARLRSEGLRVFYAPAARVEHLHPITEAGWLRIAEQEGRALAVWLHRRPEMREELVALGLQSRRLGTRALRHAAADLAINPLTEPAVLTLARTLAVFSFRAAMPIYRKLFQARKRRSIDAALFRMEALNKDESM